MNLKRPSDSLTTMNEMVLPNDTNMLNNLMGGRLLHWMDICAAISAQKHAGCVSVTAAVNNVSFAHPIKLGQVVTLISKVVRAFNTSMEVHIEVWCEDLTSRTKKKCNEAYLTFVALDGQGGKVKVPEIQPLTEDEVKLFDAALIRRQMKLLMAGKISLENAPELKAQFEEWQR